MPYWAYLIAITVFWLGALILNRRYRFMGLDAPLAIQIAFFICWGALLFVTLDALRIGLTLDLLRGLPRTIGIGMLFGAFVAVLLRITDWGYDNWIKPRFW